MDFQGKRVTVMGLGHFGGQIGVVRFLADEGAGRIVVTDTKSADELAGSVAAIVDLPNVVLRLGGHVEEDFTQVDGVIASPAVRQDSPLLAAARRGGAKVTSEINLFFELCAAPIVGITGSVGKSTTSAMIAAVVAAAAPPGCAVHFGGNIGHHALLPVVRRIRPTDRVVLELSSFQLETLGQIARSPAVAVVTNITPNHLDRHGTMAEYVRCKQNILRFQRTGDAAVLNAEDPALADWAGLTTGRVIWYSADDAAGLDLQVVGRHNRSNAAAALAVGRALGLAEEKVAAALADFRALPHRLEPVGQVHGVRYYNDSKSTTPESLVTALAAFDNDPLIVIVGGYDKRIDLGPACRALAERAKHVIAIGATGEKFRELIERQGSGIGGRGSGQNPIADWRESGGRSIRNPKSEIRDRNCQVCVAADLAEAVQLAARAAAPGDVVLLSPGCASYDQFRDYEERGERFRQWVSDLPREPASDGPREPRGT